MRRRANRRRGALRLLLAAMIVPAVLLIMSPIRDALAEKIENDVAVFAALDKVTARISHLQVPIGEQVRFGALVVTPRVCFSRDPTEPPLTSGFVEVDEIKLNGETQRIFTGWMFAESPGLHAVEHPVFDVWLTACKTSEGEALEENLEKSADPNRASSRRP